MARHIVPVGTSSPRKRFTATFAQQVVLAALVLAGFACPSVSLV